MECSNYSDCTSLYDVSTNDVNLIVTKVNENYIVNMEGKGSYAGISMEESTCPKNSYCSTNSISSNISSNGEEKETNIGSLLVLNVKNKTPINCKIDEDCSKYGKEIIEITSSTGGYAVTKGENIIIYDKNGNILTTTDQAKAQKYKNLISLTEQIDRKTSNNNLKGTGATCNGEIAIYEKTRSDTDHINNYLYNKSLINNSYKYYLKDGFQLFIYKCDGEFIAPTSKYGYSEWNNT